MQFNVVNDQEQVVQFVWHGGAWCGIALHGVCIRAPATFVAWLCIKSVWCFSRAFSAAPLHIRLCLD